jgi:hypothetical protein
MLPSRQRNFDAFDTVRKWFASGPSMNTTGLWSRRSENTGPYFS